MIEGFQKQPQIKILVAFSIEGKKLPLHSPLSSSCCSYCSGGTIGLDHGKYHGKYHVSHYYDPNDFVIQTVRDSCG